MPRKSSGLREAQRLRQQRYRQKLSMKAEPEVGDLDTAAAIAIARMVQLVSERNGHTPQRLMNLALTSGVNYLNDKGFARQASHRLLLRRISGLKMGLETASAKK
jgi:hypothetical protein